MAIRQPHSLRPVLSTAGMSFGFALGGMAITDAALAQDASLNDAQPRADAVTLDTVVISSSEQPANTNAGGTGLSRLPGTVFETPREVQVIPAEIIRQQQATTLQEALRNVPGITLSTGEGRGGSNGDQFRIRGLAAQGDVYRDGLRDFGIYTHDNFNTESVEVLKGPSGDGFGVGNMGGLINQSTKRARMVDETTVNGLVGSGTIGRVQVDSNRIVGENQALRFNIMGQRQDVADRDHVESNRAGVALDWGTGIGTGTEWHLGYSYLRDRGTPDMGQPMAEGDDGISRPLLEFGVPGYDRDISYVRSTDRNRSDVHDLTSSLSHDMGNGWTLTNDTRLARYKRERSATNPASVTNDDLHLLLSGIDVPLSYGAGGGITNDQDGWGFQNVLAGRSEFQTGGITHKVQVGLDLSYQVDHRRSGSWDQRNTDSTVLHPVFDSPGSVLTWSDDRSRATVFNAGLFVSDRMSFGNGWTIAGAARLDHFENTFDGPIIGDTLNSSGSSTEISPSLSIIYEPNQDMMAYLSLSRTYRPQGTDIAHTVGAGDREVAGDLSPERADLVELGGKLNLLDGRLGLTGAIFQINKTHSYDIDPDTGEPVLGWTDAGSARRIRGVELGVSGQVSDNWMVYANYAYLDGKVRSGVGIDPEVVGLPAPGVSKNNLSLWTSYSVPQASTGWAGDLTVAGGVRYASGYNTSASATSSAKIPETLSLDMMVAYEQDDWRVALNAYNLTDHDNYSSAFGGSRVVPEAGRTFALSIGKRF